MADVGTRFTDKRQAELEKRLRRIYSDAAKDIEAKMRDFNRRYKVKEAKYRQMLKDGKITQADFDSWVRGQVFQGKQWQAKKDQITETLYQSNQIAARMVHGETVGVFAHNANFMSYQLEHTAGVNFGFGIYDSAAVTRLIRDQPNLLPPSHVKRSKDKRWNSRKITEQITQGIIQGESLDKIAKRMAQTVGQQDWKFMRTYAQTAMTGAQNAGRQLSLQNAKSMDIKVKKEWMATLDGHTRTEHRELDGQKVDTDKPFKTGGYTIMYPGDPHAHPAMVYNCRCTLVGDLEDYPSEYERYDNIEGKPIKNMTYSEWYNAKKQAAGEIPNSIPKQLEVIHLTSESNVRGILENGFDLERSGEVGGDVFGDGVYFLMDDATKDFYESKFGSSSGVEATVDTSDMVYIRLNGFQYSPNNMYENVIRQLPVELQEEYNQLMEHRRSVRRNLVSVLKKHYDGMILEHITPDGSIEGTVGGSQIVVYNLKKIKKIRGL